MTMRAATLRSRGRAVRAFSLIEMLIVIGLVVVLASLTVVVGRSVIAKSKIDQCRQILQTLDATLTEYQAERGGIPPFDESAYSPRLRTPAPWWPEVAAYLGQVTGYPGIDKQLGTIDSKFLTRRKTIYDDLAGVLDVPKRSKRSDDRPSVRDPWGMEILYIHPSLGNDSDLAPILELYGKPVNERPYFMSAGPDGEYETLQDNVYSYEVIKPGANNG